LHKIVKIQKETQELRYKILVRVYGPQRSSDMIIMLMIMLYGGLSIGVAMKTCRTEI